MQPKIFWTGADQHPQDQPQVQSMVVSGDVWCAHKGMNTTGVAVTIACVRKKNRLLECDGV